MVNFAVQTRHFSQEFTGVLLHQLEEAKWTDLEKNPLSDESEAGGAKIFRSLFLAEVTKGLAQKECADLSKQLEQDILKNNPQHTLHAGDIHSLEMFQEVAR